TGVVAYNVAEVVEAPDMAVGAWRRLECPGEIERLELPVGEPIEMIVSVRPRVPPGNLSRIVHPPRLCVLGSRILDRRECPTPQHEAVPPILPILVVAGDFTIGVDAPGHGLLRTGHVNGCEDTSAKQKCVISLLAEETIMAHNVS